MATCRYRMAPSRLSERDFAWITREVVAIAERCCEGRVVSTLEGGYELRALATSVPAHVGALMED